MQQRVAVRLLERKLVGFQSLDKEGHHTGPNSPNRLSPVLISPEGREDILLCTWETIVIPGAYSTASITKSAVSIHGAQIDRR